VTASFDKLPSGKSPDAARINKKTRFRILIDLHIEDMAELGKSPKFGALSVDGKQ